jgi:AcrR family transcriptional regulator
MAVTKRGAVRQPTLRSDSIFTAALHLFATRGYRATTMTDIGAAIGIRGPSLYKHVESKQSLLIDIIVGTLKALTAVQRRVLGEPCDIELRFKQLVEAHVRYNVTHHSETLIIARESSNLEEPSYSEARELRSEYELALRGVIQQGVAEGKFNTQHPRLVSHSVLEMGIGIGSWYAPDTMHTVDEIAEVYGVFALRMLLAPMALT